VDERDWLAARFQAHRPRLRAVAYRMPGSTSEADDAVQEAWIRLSRANAGAIDNLEAWLASAVGGWRPTCAAPASRGASSHRRRICRTRSWTAPDSIDPEHQALVAAARLGLVGVACAGQRRGRLGRPGRRGRLRVAALTLQGGRVTRVDVLLDRARPARLGLTAFRRPP
jgi:Sigma-70 region 2